MKILAAELDENWLTSQQGIKVLSLDCFDTLFWRRVAAPTDVFFELAHSPIYQKHKLTATLRMRSESEARRKKLITHGSNEVTLHDIYRHALPSVTEEDILALMEAELEHEIRHGFIFEPVWKLIQAARRRGLKVAVVSDIYFSESQLKRLLYGTMPALEGNIDAFFCSSTHSQGKSGTLWNVVIDRLRVSPREICHLGDNYHADYAGALRHQIRAHHLVHHQSSIVELLEQRVQAALQLFPHLRYRAALPSLFHGQLATYPKDDPAARLGYATVGPILLAFSRYLVQEIQQLRSQGRRVRTAFLMRDGYLPSRACAAFTGDALGADINISRFTAIAATLDSKQAVLNLLETSLGSNTMEPLLKQLLLPAEQAAAILAKAKSAGKPEREFVQQITKPRVIKSIVERSAIFRQKLLLHVKARTGLERGEILVFVDLGYTGTAQKLLAPVFKAELDVELVGRYLICHEGQAGANDRKGLIDPEWVDPRLTALLTGQFIAAFEMLCTQRPASTIDYDDAGEPILSSTGLNSQQHCITDTVQEACLQFIRDYAATDAPHRASANDIVMRESAAIDLARLLYLPTQSEIRCLESFKFDLNLGTSMKMDLIDTEASLTGMRRRGFLYMGTDIETFRTSYPMELRHLDISLSSLLLAQNRLGFAINPLRASFRSETLKVLIADEKNHTIETVEATATHDGYFVALVPLSPRFDTALLLGPQYEWIQIESIQRVPNLSLAEGVAMQWGSDVLPDQFKLHSGGVCSISPNGLLLFSRQPADKGVGLARMVFRPLVARLPGPDSPVGPE